jgi:2-oxoisovalerate dehydrogenase E1 component
MDRLEIEQLTPQGKIKYQFSAHGHELTQVLLAQALDHPHDAATVYYRSRPFALACGLSPSDALAAGMARAAGPTLGRDVGVMFNLPRRAGITILPSSGDVGAQYTPAVGWAQASQYHSRVLGEADWQNAIAVALGGESSVAANGFWAALNIVTTLKLPLLFFIEDNSFGISVLRLPGARQTLPKTWPLTATCASATAAATSRLRGLAGYLQRSGLCGAAACLLRMRAAPARPHLRG